VAVVIVFSLSILGVTGKTVMMVTTIVATASRRQASFRREEAEITRSDPLLAWVSLGAEPGIAPGSLERVRALLNTDDRFHGVDHLAGTGQLPLRDLRDALRRYLSTGDAADLSALAARYPLVVTFDDDGGAGLTPAGADELVADLLAEVHRAHAAGEWPRLKACANPDCQWIYYDGSRNRSGRWCSMNECGDVMKARAYRRRARGASPSS
jgi:hypothetical protein